MSNVIAVMLFAWCVVFAAYVLVKPQLDAARAIEHMTPALIMDHAIVD